MQARPWLGIDHINKTAKRTRYSYQEKAIKIHNWAAVCLRVLSVLRHLAGWAAPLCLAALSPLADSYTSWEILCFGCSRFLATSPVFVDPSGRPGGRRVSCAGWHTSHQYAKTCLHGMPYLSEPCEVFVLLLYIYMQNKYMSWKKEKKFKSRTEETITKWFEGRLWVTATTTTTFQFLSDVFGCCVGVVRTLEWIKWMTAIPMAKVANNIVPGKAASCAMVTVVAPRKGQSGFEFVDLARHGCLSYRSLVSTLCLSRLSRVRWDPHRLSTLALPVPR